MAKSRTDTEAVVKLVINGQQAKTSLKELTDTQRSLNTALRNMKPSDPGYKKHLAEIQLVNKALAEQRKEISGMSSEGKKLAASWKDIAAGVVGGMGITEGIGLIKGFGQQVFDTTAKFQKLEAVLTTTLGSKSAAQMAMQQITDFAAATPFQVDQLTESYVKLANQGFKPSMDQLRSLGDLSASTGKEFDQLAEAIIDAQTGEFERLKEFGIRAEKDGDKVRFTFKGITQEVDFTSDSIRNYITQLGNIEGVAGSMAGISETLSGKVSNLGDSWESLLKTVGDETQGVFSGAISLMGSAISQLTEYMRNLNEAQKYSAPGTSFMDRVSELGNVVGGGPNIAALKRQAFATVSASFDTRIGEAKYAREVLEIQSDLIQRMKSVDRSTREGAAAYNLYADKLKLVKDRIEGIKSDRLTEANIKASDAAKKAAAEEEKRRKAAEKAVKALESEHKKLSDLGRSMQQDFDTKNLSGLEQRLAEISNKYDPLIEKAKKFKDEALAGIFKVLKDGEVDQAKSNAKKEADAGAVDAFNGQFNLTEGLIEKASKEKSLENKNRLADGEISDEEFQANEYELEGQRLMALKLLYEAYGKDSIDFERQLTDRKLEEKQRLADGHRELAESEMATEAAVWDAMSTGVSMLKGIVDQSSSAFKALLVAEKAIAIAKVIMNTQAEISGYYAKYALVPGGMVIASGLAAQAKIRSGISIGIIGAQGIAEAISSNKSENNSSSKPTYAAGGILPDGPSHSEGGLKLVDKFGNVQGEIEGGEPILSRETYRNNRQTIDALLYSSQRQNGANISISTSKIAASERHYRAVGVIPVGRGRSGLGGSSTSSTLSNGNDTIERLFEQLIDAVEAEKARPLDFNLRTFDDTKNRVQSALNRQMS